MDALQGDTCLAQRSLYHFFLKFPPPCKEGRTRGEIRSTAKVEALYCVLSRQTTQNTTDSTTTARSMKHRTGAGLDYLLSCGNALSCLAAGDTLLSLVSGRKIITRTKVKSAQSAPTVFGSRNGYLSGTTTGACRAIRKAKRARRKEFVRQTRILLLTSNLV